MEMEGLLQNWKNLKSQNIKQKVQLFVKEGDLRKNNVERKIGSMKKKHRTSSD